MKAAGVMGCGLWPEFFSTSKCPSSVIRKSAAAATAQSANLSVVRIGDDETPTEAGFDVANVAVELRRQIEDPRHLFPRRPARVAHNDFFVFEPDFGRDCHLQPSAGKRFFQWRMRRTNTEHLHRGIRIQDDCHARDRDRMAARASWMISDT